MDTKLNKFLWSQGIKGVPGRVRVRLARKRNDDEEAAEKLYTLCMHVPVERYQYKGLQTEIGVGTLCVAWFDFVKPF